MNSMIRADAKQTDEQIERLKVRHKELSGWRYIESVMDWLAGWEEEKSDERLAPIDRMIEAIPAEIERLKQSGHGEPPIAPLFELLKSYVDQPEKFRWHYLGIFQGSAANCFCKHHGIDRALVSGDIVMPFRAPRAIRCERHEFTREGNGFAAFIGQCGDCGAIYWGMDRDWRGMRDHP